MHVSSRRLHRGGAARCVRRARDTRPAVFLWTRREDDEERQGASRPDPGSLHAHGGGLFFVRDVAPFGRGRAAGAHADVRLGGRGGSQGVGRRLRAGHIHAAACGARASGAGTGFHGGDGRAGASRSGALGKEQRALSSRQCLRAAIFERRARRGRMRILLPSFSRAGSRARGDGAGDASRGTRGPRGFDRAARRERGSPRTPSSGCAIHRMRPR